MFVCLVNDAWGLVIEHAWHYHSPPCMLPAKFSLDPSNYSQVARTYSIHQGGNSWWGTFLEHHPFSLKPTPHVRTE